MKFGQQFEANMVEEWRQYYLRYRDLKRLIAELFPKHREEEEDGADEEKVALVDVTYNIAEAADRRTDYGSTGTRMFGSAEERKQRVWDELLRELDKVDEWYKVVESQLEGRFAALEQQMEHQQFPLDPSKKETKNLKENFIHLLRRETQLVNFGALNRKGFQKVIKNFVKHSKFDIRDEFNAEMNSRYFVQSRRANDLISRTYELYAKYFEDGDIDRARIAMLAKLSEAEYGRTDALRLGIKLGAILLMAVWLLLHFIDPGPNAKIPGRPPMQPDLELYPVIPVYRSLYLVVFAIWLWGLCVWMWTKFRISYVFVFEFNPRTRLSHFQIFNEAANLTLILLVSSLLQVSHHRLWLGSRYVSKHAYPIATFLYFLIKLLVPLRPFSYWPSRRAYLETLYQVVISPWGRLRFRDIFLANWLTSMPRIGVDVYAASFIYLTAFFLDGKTRAARCNDIGLFVAPLLCALPLWFRIAQSFRKMSEDERQRTQHLTCAVIHLLALLVVLMDSFLPPFESLFATGHPFRVLWVILVVTTALSFFLYDVRVDWGLFTFEDPERPLLRGALVFPHRTAVYYSAMAADFVLRFVWVISILPFPIQSIPALQDLPRLLVTPFLVVLELIRRAIWSVFTVEYEHIKTSSDIQREWYVPLFDNESTEQRRKAATSVTGYGVLFELTALVLILLLAHAVAPTLFPETAVSAGAATPAPAGP